MKLGFAIILTIIAHCSFSQIDFTPYPANDTYCPGQLESYTSSVTGSNCGVRTWTITNGKFRDPQTLNYVSTITGTSVDVRWDDVAAIGKIKVTVSCGVAPDVEVYMEEKNFSIKSLTGVIPGNIRSDSQPQYCSINSVWVLVDPVKLPSTGGTTGITEQRADGYEWTLPPGWKYNGSIPTGPVTTAEEWITITPEDGCKGGSVTVKAFVSCISGKKYSSSSSALSLNRPIGTSLSVPNGYTGPACGNITPVTFAATSLSCATNYRWTATNTQWKDSNGALGPWNTATNTLTLTPTGSISDSGQIAAEITLSCGTIITQTYTAIYQDPLSVTILYFQQCSTALQ